MAILHRQQILYYMAISTNDLQYFQPFIQLVGLAIFSRVKQTELLADQPFLTVAKLNNTQSCNSLFLYVFHDLRSEHMGKFT